MISPLSGSKSPTRHFISTVLPLPLVPMIRLHLPVLNTVLTSLITALSPKPFLIFFISIILFLSVDGRLPLLSSRGQQQRREQVIRKQHQHTADHHRFRARPADLERSALHIVSVKGGDAGDDKSKGIGLGH